MEYYTVADGLGDLDVVVKLGLFLDDLELLIQEAHVTESFQN